MILKKIGYCLSNLFYYKQRRVGLISCSFLIQIKRLVISHYFSILLLYSKERLSHLSIIKYKKCQ
nr:MAG TPA: hypothetical protein [Caudoviricetes sp.]